METIGAKALQTVIKQEQNVRVINRALLLATKHDPDRYETATYQVVGDILAGKSLKDVLNSVKKGKFGWNHSHFQPVSVRVEEHDDFIRDPFEVEEGVLQCKCGSTRVFSYSKQCRGADEPMTTFAQCVRCRARWQYSG